MLQIIFRCVVILVMVSIIMTVINVATVSFDVGNPFVNNLITIFYICYYFIPFDKLLPLIVLSISFTVFKVTVSLIKSVWDIFPLRG